MSRIYVDMHYFLPKSNAHKWYDQHGIRAYYSFFSLLFAFFIYPRSWGFSQSRSNHKNIWKTCCTLHYFSSKSELSSYVLGHISFSHVCCGDNFSRSCLFDPDSIVTKLVTNENRQCGHFDLFWNGGVQSKAFEWFPFLRSCAGKHV